MSNDRTKAVLPPPPKASAWRAALELLRLPNWFTAVADVLMGYLLLAAGSAPRIGPELVLLVLASLQLYAAGMVLNDVFDFEIDARQRPARPLPSGRVERSTARRWGWRLLAGGVATSWVVALLAGGWRPGVVGTLLAAAVVLYDGVLKSTPLAPWVMGSCRGLNVLLGMSVPVSLAWEMPHRIVAAGIAVYVTGVTSFARGEAGRSRRGPLLLGIAIMLLGLALVASFPVWFSGGPGLSSPLVLTEQTFPWLIVGLGALLAWRWAWAVVEPLPPQVQAAVRVGIWTLILLDAAVVWAAQGPAWAAPVALLVVPTALLGRWLYAT